MEVDEKGEYGVDAAAAACETKRAKCQINTKLHKTNTCHVLDRSNDNYLFDKKYVKYPIIDFIQLIKSNIWFFFQIKKSSENYFDCLIFLSTWTKTITTEEI